MKKNVKIISLVAAGLLVLPVFETLNGITAVHAQAIVYAPAAREWQSPEPNKGNNQSNNQGNDQSNNWVNNQSNHNDVPAVPKTVPVHTHDFQYVMIQEASENQDEVIQLQCACGEITGQFTVPGSAQGLFIAKVIRKIANASEGATVTVDTRIWVCYTQAVMDMLMQRPDVTLVTNYRYNHVDYTVTIPAGYEVNTLVDENGYCGFRYLDQVLGGSEVVKD